MPKRHVPRDPGFEADLRRIRLEHKRYRRVGNKASADAVLAQISVESSAHRLDASVGKRAARIAQAAGDPLTEARFGEAKSRLIDALADVPGAAWLLGPASVTDREVLLTPEAIESLALDWSEWVRAEFDDSAGKPRKLKDQCRARVQREFSSFLCGLNLANIAISAEDWSDLRDVSASLLAGPPERHGS